VGGRNSVTGAVVGVVVITAGNELTRYLAGPDVDIAALDWILRDGLSQLFLGVAMVGFMIVRPAGLLGDWEFDAWLHRRWRRSRDQKPDVPDPAPETAPVTLAAIDVVVDFGGFRALDGTSIEAANTEIVGLVGPNGAGKTTLVNVITGLVDPTSGTYALGDRQLAGAPPHQIARAGLVRTFQNLRLFPALTVRENVDVAAISAARHRADRTRPSVDALVSHAELWDHRDRRASELDYGNSRRLELARAAALAPAFLLLDEPTSGMSDAESIGMIEQVRSIAALVGAGVLVIDHDLGFITGICDRVYVLDQGRVIAVGSPEEIHADPVVQAAYLGTATMS
jgi:ABC-type branched-subunit amino acid transport system ATPase component